jgi:hypothetical protein
MYNVCDFQFVKTKVFLGSPVGLNQVSNIFQNECLENNLPEEFCSIF